MLGTHDLLIFVASGLLLNITPGADSLYIGTRSASSGLRAGIAAAIGINLGCGAHVLAAALGLSAILSASATAFFLVKLVGAAYLLYMGLSLLISTSERTQHTRVARTEQHLGPVIWQGFLTNALNPKVALFFLAFVPQFIDPASSSKTLAFLFLGAIFVINSLAWCLFLAWATSRLGQFAIGTATINWLRRTVGAVFVLLGIRLAISEP